MQLGLNVPYEWWPTQPLLKSFEAAGFTHVQVPAPPVSVLASRGSRRTHSRALSSVLDTTGLIPVLHAPGKLVAGDPHPDAALEGCIEYAAAIGATAIVYHVANANGRERTGDRLRSEFRSLERLAKLALRRRVVLALENLAPVFPGPGRFNYRPQAVAAIVRRLGSPAIGMCLDVGHANITCAARGERLADVVESVLDVVSVFHVHDNLGDRREGSAPYGLDPLRLDLHLPPGGGRLPWPEIGPLLAGHGAPMVLEIHPPHRPSPLAMFEVSRRMLGGRAPVEVSAPAQSAL